MNDSNYFGNAVSVEVELIDEFPGGRACLRELVVIAVAVMVGEFVGARN